MRIVSVAGTRPEAIKLAPLVLAFRRMPGVEHHFIHTGQHDALFADALDAFALRPDDTLPAPPGGASLDEAALAIDRGLRPLLERIEPDLVIVQGDTTSAWAAAQCAHDLRLPIGHVEAGLRSGDPLLPWPEERNRIEIDRIARWLFAPTDAAAANLRAEGAPGHILVTGNTGIDALLHVADGLPAMVREDGRHRLLVTCHRRESQGPAIARIAAALRHLAARGDVAITVILHLNPAGPALRAELDGVAGITLSPSLGYAAMVAALKGATLVLSDSGGLQEECPALGVPLLVMRDNSERPEAIACGNARLVGTDTARIVAEAERLLDDPAAHAAIARPAFPYGRGDAAERIVAAITAWHARPEPG